MLRRFSETTVYDDTAPDRAMLEKNAALIGADIRFDYLAHFPDGSKAKAFLAARGTSGAARDKVTIEAAYNSWIGGKELDRIRKSRLRDYENHFRRYILPAMSGVAVDELSLPHVRELVRRRDRARPELRKARGRDPGCRHSVARCSLPRGGRRASTQITQIKSRITTADDQGEARWRCTRGRRSGGRLLLWRPPCSFGSSEQRSRRRRLEYRLEQTTNASFLRNTVRAKLTLNLWGDGICRIRKDSGDFGSTNVNSVTGENDVFS